MNQSPTSSAREAVLQPSVFDADDHIIIRGEDFSQGATLDGLVASMVRTGFQATNVGLAIEEINRMLTWRLSDRPIADNETDELKDMEVRKHTRCKIFLSYTSNMISSGIRETIRFLVQHNLVDAIVTTAGGIEEDFIKCLAPTYLGDFKLKGRDLRMKGVNRLGNLLVPNTNYCMFEDWLTPILHAMSDEQVKLGTRWSPSTMIHRLGKEINNEESVYYWTTKHNIPVFCPALTDGSIGDMLYFHSYKRPEFVLDVIQDIRAINNIAITAPCTGMVILGGGVIKHHVCNANLMRNGAEFSVYINTGQVWNRTRFGFVFS